MRNQTPKNTKIIQTQKNVIGSYLAFKHMKKTITKTRKEKKSNSFSALSSQQCQTQGKRTQIKKTLIHPQVFRVEQSRTVAVPCVYRSLDFHQAADSDRDTSIFHYLLSICPALNRWKLVVRILTINPFFEVLKKAAVQFLVGVHTSYMILFFLH